MRDKKAEGQFTQEELHVQAGISNGWLVNMEPHLFANVTGYCFSHSEVQRTVAIFQHAKSVIAENKEHKTIQLQR